MLVDSHCHLDMLDVNQYGSSMDDIIKNAKANDVGHMLCVCVELVKFKSMLEIIEPYSNVSASVGLHPNESVEIEPSIDDFIEYAKLPRVVAIGETGLDYYRTADEEQQKKQHHRFRTQITLAKQVKKPLIIHTRQAREDTIQIMKEEKASEIGGVLHCFTEDWNMAEQALELGFHISFSGIVTFKNAKQIQEVAKKVPLDRMLIETDSPYLAPMPYRGKPNQPSYVKYVAEYIAELRETTYAEIAEQTTKNYFDLFGKHADE